LATPNQASDGGLIQGEAATIASLQVPPVDVAEEDWRKCVARRGGADRSAYQSLDPHSGESFESAARATASIVIAHTAAP
jgi:hypothetical protein